MTYLEYLLLVRECFLSLNEEEGQFLCVANARAYSKPNCNEYATKFHHLNKPASHLRNDGCLQLLLNRVSKLRLPRRRKSPQPTIQLSSAAHRRTFGVQLRSING